MSAHPACLPLAPARKGVSTALRQSVAAAIIAQTLWSSAAPAMSYALFAAAWHLSHTGTTLIFAAYPAAIVAVLGLELGLGRTVADRLGRRATLLTGLAASLAGALLFATADGQSMALAARFAMALAARFAMGIGVGLCAGPATAALAEEHQGPQSARHAALITTLAQAGGFAAGLLCDGALIAYAPWKMQLNFWVLACLTGGLIAATAAIADEQPAHGPLAPVRCLSATRDGSFAKAALAMGTAMLHGVLVLSLGGQMALELLHSTNALLNAAVLAVFALSAAAAGYAARHLASPVMRRSGAACSVAGMVLLVAAIGETSMVLFLAASILAGAGYSLLFQGAVEMVAAAGPASLRGRQIGRLYLAGYAAMGGAAVLLGAIATARGLGCAVGLGAAAIGVACILIAHQTRTPAAPLH